MIAAIYFVGVVELNVVELWLLIPTVFDDVDVHLDALGRHKSNGIQLTVWLFDLMSMMYPNWTISTLILLFDMELFDLSSGVFVAGFAIV